MRWEKYILFSIGCLLSLFLRNTGYPSRDQWQQPERVMDAIGVKAGMIIGEAGAGRGYFTFKLSGWVGSTGKIYANEIDPHHLETIKQKCIERNIFNIETILGEEGDPLFPDGQLDMVIMVYVFHHLLSPTEFLQNIARWLTSMHILIAILITSAHFGSLPISSSHNKSKNIGMLEFLAWNYNLGIHFLRVGDSTSLCIHVYMEYSHEPFQVLGVVLWVLTSHLKS